LDDQRIPVSEGSSSSITSSHQLGSGHNGGSQDSLVVFLESWISVEQKVNKVVILISRKQLGSSNSEDFEGESLSVGLVLSLLVITRESHKASVASSSNKDTPCQVGWEVGKNVESGLSTSNGGEVEGSSMRVGKIPLSLEESEV